MKTTLHELESSIMDILFLYQKTIIIKQTCHNTNNISTIMNNVSCYGGVFRIQSNIEGRIFCEKGEQIYRLLKYYSFCGNQYQSSR